MKLPNIIANPNEEYVTIPALKTFVKENGIVVPKDEKSAYIAAISEYADQSLEAKETVVTWIDEVVKEGIKEIQVMNIPLSNELDVFLSCTTAAQHYLEHFLSTRTPHLAGNSYDNNYSLVKADIQSNTHGNFISLLFCRMLRYHDIKKNHGGIVEYPVYVDYYYERGWLIIRYKSRSGLYPIMPEGTPIEEWLTHSLNVGSEIKQVFEQVKHILRFGNFDIHTVSASMQTKFFDLLDKYTHTPTEILQILDENKLSIDTLRDILTQMCGLPMSYHSKVEEDLKTMAEKYLSITWPNKDIFIKDREAYPTRLTTTDEEDSRIDQTAATEADPLQSKEVFFDNKRMLYNQKRCEGLTLMWRRIDRKYYGEFFPVRFSEKRGICTLSFKKYVAEEDILHVLFAIIDT